MLEVAAPGRGQSNSLLPLPTCAAAGTAGLCWPAHVSSCLACHPLPSIKQVLLVQQTSVFNVPLDIIQLLKDLACGSEFSACKWFPLGKYISLNSGYMSTLLTSVILIR